jgi:hypothetical protein
MSDVVIRNVLDPAAINRLLTSPQGGVARDLLRRGYKVQGAARRLCPVDHGRLRNSIIPILVVRSGMVICEVGTDVEYAMFVHNGTGIYGPRHMRINVGHVMVWQARKATQTGKFIPKRFRSTTFAMSTRGMRGTPFLKDALPAAMG